MTTPQRTQRGESALLQVAGISKRYGVTKALDDVDFELAGGEILSVLGQNGAGKSTLVKILAGVVRPSSGSIRLRGKTERFHSTRDALRRGVVLIPQELAYVRDLSVAENILLGSWGARGRLVSPRQMVSRARQFADAVGLEVSLRATMSTLSLAQCQLVEIAKALSRDAAVLLLDEPTAALSDAESEQLFEAIGSLRRRGVAMIYISHRLDEVLSRTDRLLVLRDGRVATIRDTATATRDEVIEEMIGHRAVSVEGSPAARAHASDRAQVISLRGVSHRGRGLRGIDLELGAGEVVVAFGVAGAGYEALAMTIAGRLPHSRGELRLDGRLRGPIRSVRQARREGISYVPPDRKIQGLILDQSVRRNMTFPQLRRFSRMLVMCPGREERLVRTVAARLSLRYASSAQPVGQLSGGNQQKILLASRIYAEPRMLVVQEPTRGVDVAAREEIHELLIEFARQGRTVICATSDVEEAVALADRLVVMRGGRIAAILEKGEKNLRNAVAAAGRVRTEG